MAELILIVKCLMGFKDRRRLSRGSLCKSFEVAVRDERKKGEGRRLISLGLEQASRRAGEQQGLEAQSEEDAAVKNNM